MANIQKEILPKLKFLSAAGIIFTLPLSVHLSGFFILVSLGLSILYVDLKTLRREFILRRRVYLILIYPLACVIGLFYTEDFKSGMSLLERLFPFLAFPLLIALNPELSDKRIVDKILFLFTIMIVLIGMMLLIIAVYRVIASGEWINSQKLLDREYYYFMNQELTEPIRLNPIYFGLFINFSLAYLMERIYRGQDYRLILFIAFLLVMQLLVFSLNAMIGLAILAGIASFLFLRYKFNKRWILASYISIALVAFASFHFIKPFKNRLNFTRQTDYQEPHIKYWNGISMRLAIWDCCLALLPEVGIIGVGTGDVEAAILRKYREKNFYFGYTLELNAHNQFLQSYIMTGILGVASLLFIFYRSMIIALKEHHLLLQLFLIIIFVAFLTEAVIQTQKGVVFFSMFLSLLINPSRIVGTSL